MRPCLPLRLNVYPSAGSPCRPVGLQRTHRPLPPRMFGGSRRCSNRHQPAPAAVSSRALTRPVQSSPRRRYQLPTIVAIRGHVCRHDQLTVHIDTLLDVKGGQDFVAALHQRRSAFVSFFRVDNPLTYILVRIDTNAFSGRRYRSNTSVLKRRSRSCGTRNSIVPTFMCNLRV